MQDFKIVSQRQADDLVYKARNHNIQHALHQRHQNNLCSSSLDQDTESSVLVDLEDLKPSLLQQTVKLHLRPLHGPMDGEHMHVEHVPQSLTRFVQNGFGDVQTTALGFRRYGVADRFEDSETVIVDPVVQDETHEENLFLDLRTKEVVGHERDSGLAFWRAFFPELRFTTRNACVSEAVGTRVSVNFKRVVG